MKNSVIIAAIVALLIGAGGGFFAGMKYQQGQTPQIGGQGSGFGGAGGGRNRQGGNGANRPVFGTVVSEDDKSLTVQLMDGSTKLVLIAGSTSLNKAAEATKTDFVVGSRVAAYGTQNSDGSMTAQSIQLNPMLRGPQNDQSPSPSPKQ